MRLDSASPSGLADGRHRDDVDRQVEVADHAPDAGELLRVLLAEKRDVGAGEVQQLAHDGQHAVEVARPARALEHVAQRTGADPDERRPVGVDDLGRRV